MHKIRAEDVLREYWDGNIPIDIVGIIQRMKDKQEQKIVVELERKLDINPKFSGQVERLSESSYKISYNPNGSRNRKRFTIAHELGHVFLEHLEIGQTLNSEKKGYILKTDDPIEAQANKFAMELLMPSFVITSLISKGDVDTFDGLVNLFQVSETAMYYRLKDLGYLKGA